MCVIRRRWISRTGGCSGRKYPSLVAGATETALLSRGAVCRSVFFD